MLSGEPLLVWHLEMMGSSQGWPVSYLYYWEAGGILTPPPIVMFIFWSAKDLDGELGVSGPQAHF